VKDSPGRLVQSRLAWLLESAVQQHSQHRAARGVLAPRAGAGFAVDDGRVVEAAA
jgi:hypothetical protein